jgi:hypothetical protein
MHGGALERSGLDREDLADDVVREHERPAVVRHDRVLQRLGHAACRALLAQPRQRRYRRRLEAAPHHRAARQHAARVGRELGQAPRQQRAHAARDRGRVDGAGVEARREVAQQLLDPQRVALRAVVERDDGVVGHLGAGQLGDVALDQAPDVDAFE